MNTLTALPSPKPSERRSLNRADQIVDELVAILSRTAERQRLAPLAAAQLESVRRRLLDAQVELLELQKLVVLNVEDPLGAEMVRAAAAWRAITPDVDSRELADLVSASPTLTSLHHAAVTIESAHRFSDERIELATRIGETISEFPQYVGQLVKSSRGQRFGVKVAASDKVRKLLKILGAAGAVKDFVLEARVGKPADDIWLPIDKVHRGQRPSGWRVAVGTVSPEFKPFLQGHWLTAYAYGIARDQFCRAGRSFEIFSNLTYRLPGDLGGGASDIDVLVRTDDRLMCIECKSGRVLQARSGDAAPVARTVHNATSLDSALTRMGLSLSCSYHLLYLPTEAEPIEDVSAAAAADVRVTVLGPADVRAELTPDRA